MGRNAAGESFLRGFLRHSRADGFFVDVRDPSHAEGFASAARAAGRTEPVRSITAANLGDLAQAEVLYQPDPMLGAQAWRRAAFGHGSWSLCGITHTTASAGVMDGIADLLVAPVQPWDALICTSHAVKDNVERLLNGQRRHLRERLGATRVVMPQLPVIPLGIHTEDFEFSAEQRDAARAELGVTETTLVVLFMGRLSFHAKAHPLALYQALETAARATGRDVLLIECGWHANDFIAAAYDEAARFACPGVRVAVRDGRLPQVRQGCWAAADIFCSLSDNIQETFGLVPLEAMAAGLPVIVADWDGYRETVRDGIDGFRIPTMAPPPGMSGDLALRHALGVDSYDLYCGNTCSFVAVDIPATVAAFERLFASAALRREMGESGRRRAREAFDWQVIIARYEALWSQLSDLRREGIDRGEGGTPARWPARRDPFEAFAAYPSRPLTPDTVLSLAAPDADTALRRLEALANLKMVRFARAVLPAPDELRAVLTQAASGQQTAEALVADIPRARRAIVSRGLLWLVKMGVLKVG
jgi:alpha-maltose-1-phosphate synthase